MGSNNNRPGTAATSPAGPTSFSSNSVFECAISAGAPYAIGRDNIFSRKTCARTAALSCAGLQILAA
jgi:hypothetical protein